MAKKKKEMNRTAGTAKRLLGRSEAIGFKLKAGMPLTGSASGVKSITTREAGEALTQGIVTLGKKNKLQVDPASLAFALPVGKLGKAAQVLSKAGKAGDVAKAVGAQSIARRLAAKAAGRSAGRDIAAAGGKKYLESPVGKFSILGGGAKAKISEGSTLRNASERVFPRAAGAVGESSREITARLGRQSNLPMELKRQTSQAVKQTGTGFTKFSKRVAGPQPATKALKATKVKVKMGPRVSSLLNDYLEMKPNRRGK